MEEQLLRGEKNRVRDKQLKVWVTEEERKMIDKKMELAGYDTYNDYIVRMAIDGFVIIQDFANFIEVSKLLHEIGADINKIAHRADILELQEERIKRGEQIELPETPITISDIEKIDKHMEKIWKTLNKLLKAQSGSTAQGKNRKALREKIKEDEEKKKLDDEIDDIFDRR